MKSFTLHLSVPIRVSLKRVFIKKFKALPKGEGFTLVETLVVIAIFTFIIGLVFSIVVILYRTQSYTWQQSQAIDEARRGIETMVREIRTARGGDDGSYIIEKANDFEFIFYADIDKDIAAERVRYFIQGTDFKKGVINPVGWPIQYPLANEEISILSQYVRNQPPIFRYYGGDGNELAVPARLKDTKLMKVYLVINADLNRPPQDFILESAVQLRNLKTNL